MGKRKPNIISAKEKKRPSQGGSVPNQGPAGVKPLALGFNYGKDVAQHREDKESLKRAGASKKVQDVRKEEYRGKVQQGRKKRIEAAKKRQRDAGTRKHKSG